MADTPARADDKSTSLTVSNAASLLEGFLGDDAESKPEEEQTEGEEKPEEEVTDDSEQAEESEEDPETEDEEDDTPPAPRKHKVKAGDNGEEIEVDEEDLKAGYLRRQDYTRKTQAAAEERKKAETVQTEAAKEREALATKLKAVDEALKQATPPEPDWADLKKKMKPEQFATAYIEWQEHQKKLAIVAQARAEAEKKVSDDRAEAMRKFVASETEKLVEAIPEWKDPVKHRAGMASLAQFAVKVAGFTREELSTVTDHRVIRLLKAAQTLHEQKKSRPDPKKQAEKTGKSVTPPTGGDPSKKAVPKATRALQSHAKLGTVQSAAAALAAMMPD